MGRGIIDVRRVALSAVSEPSPFSKAPSSIKQAKRIRRLQRIITSIATQAQKRVGRSFANGGVPPDHAYMRKT